MNARIDVHKYADVGACDCIWHTVDNSIFIDFLKSVQPCEHRSGSQMDDAQNEFKSQTLATGHFAYRFDLANTATRIFSRLNKHVISLMCIEFLTHYILSSSRSSDAFEWHRSWIILFIWLSLSVSAACSNYSPYIVRITIKFAMRKCETNTALVYIIEGERWQSYE